MTFLLSLKLRFIHHIREIIFQSAYPLWIAGLIVPTKRKEVDHIPWVWGSVPRALRARGSPAIILFSKMPAEVAIEL